MLLSFAAIIVMLSLTCPLWLLHTRHVIDYMKMLTMTCRCRNDARRPHEGSAHRRAVGGPAVRGLVEHVNGVELADEVAAAQEFVQVDLAHALMLTEQGVFGREQGRSIVAALLRLLDDGPEQVLAGDPEIGTIALQIEQLPQGAVRPRRPRHPARPEPDRPEESTSVRMTDRRALHEGHG